jgi:membrane protein DedA with SNARE-associated domain
MLQSLINTLASLPPHLIYLFIGAGAAVENFVPPVPADTFVLLGAFLSGGGRVNAWTVFLVTWGMNVGSACLVYYLGNRFGPTFFKQHHLGKMLINDRQLHQIGGFYRKWGTPAIFFSRFLPAFRAMVPVFAGVTHVSFWRVFFPLALASGLWYGLLVYLGAVFGRNWRAVMAFFQQASTVLLVIAGVLVVAFVVWWVKSRGTTLHRSDH